MVPPAAVTSAVPSHTVAHKGSVEPVIAAVKTAGSVMFAVTEMTHPFASVTSTELVPTQSAVAASVVSPLFHK